MILTFYHNFNFIFTFYLNFNFYLVIMTFLALNYDIKWEYFYYEG